MVRVPATRCLLQLWRTFFFGNEGKSLALAMVTRPCCGSCVSRTTVSPTLVQSGLVVLEKLSLSGRPEIAVMVRCCAWAAAGTRRHAAIIARRTAKLLDNER